MTKNMEKDFIAHILSLESSFSGLTTTDLRRIGVAKKYTLSHRFNNII